MSATPDPAKATGKTLAKTWAKPPAKVGTTGHEWDGIQELNTPLPRWWLWMFRATIIWSIGYWVVYPSWPLISSYSGGLFHWHTRSSVASQLAELQQERGAMMTKLSATSLERDRNHTGIARFRAGARPARLRGQLRALSRRRWRRRQGLPQPERQ